MFYLKKISEKYPNLLQNKQYLQNGDRIKCFKYVLFFSLGYISVISGTTKSPEKSSKKVTNNSSLEGFGFLFKHAHMRSHTHPELFKKYLYNLPHYLLSQNTKTK